MLKSTYQGPGTRSWARYCAHAAASSSSTTYCTRTEVSTGPGHRDFEVTADASIPIEDDLARRDFTCNAVAVELPDGRVLDPWNGRDDLDRRVLRAMGRQMINRRGPEFQDLLVDVTESLKEIFQTSDYWISGSRLKPLPVYLWPTASVMKDYSVITSVQLSSKGRI